MRWLALIIFSPILVYWIVFTSLCEVCTIFASKGGVLYNIPVTQKALLEESTEMLVSSLDSVGREPYCGESLTITCRTNQTNSVDFCIEPLGCHTYEPTSERLAMIGPATLELLNVKTENFLSIFDIQAIIPLNSGFDVVVTCFDGVSRKSLNVAINSGQCKENISTLQKDATCGNCTESMESHSNAKLEWTGPSCSGWDNIVNYTISLCSTAGCIAREVNESQFCYCNLTFGTYTHNISAVNTCGEETLIESSDFVIVDDGVTPKPSDSKAVPALEISLGAVGGLILLVGASAFAGIIIVLCQRKRGRKKNYSTTSS